MKRNVLVPLTSLVLLASASFAHATDEWLRTTSGLNSWTIAVEWSENRAPGAGETALFDLATASSVGVHVGTVSDPHILFDGAAGSYSLTETNFSVGTAGDIVELGSTATSFTGSNVTETVSGNFTDNGQTLTFENNSTNTTDGLQFTGGTISGTGLLTLDGASTANSTVQFTNPSATVIVANPLNIVSSSISVPAVVKNGSGTWELSGTNSFTSLSVNNGTLAFTQAAALGTSPISLGVNGETSGTLESVGSGAVTISNNITVHGAGALSWVYGSGPTFSGTETITDSTLTFVGTTPYSPYNTGLTVSGKITGGTAATFDSNVDVVYGQTAFQNAGNDYAGSTNIYNGGQLFTTAGGQLPTGTVVNLGAVGGTSADTGVLYIGSDQTIAALNSVTGSNTGVANVRGDLETRAIPGVGPFVTLTISGVNSDGQAVNSSFDGALTDGYQPGYFSDTALKITGGVVTFTGNQNNYSGGTAVAGGTFFANNTTGSATGRGVVSVISGGMLRGSGTIVPTTTGAGVTVADGGVVKPGTAAAGNVAQGFLQFILDSTQSHILDFQAPTSGIAQLEFTLGGGAAPVVFTGLTFSGSSSFLKLVFNSAGEVQFNDNLVQIDDLTDGGLAGKYLLFSGSDNSDYAGLTTEASGLITSGLALTGADAARYADGALYLKNGDIYFAVPEPSSWMLFAVGFLVVTLGRSGFQSSRLRG